MNKYNNNKSNWIRKWIKVNLVIKRINKKYNNNKNKYNN